MGFGVGLWNWPDHDLGALERTGATFTIMNGYLRGTLVDPDGAAELLATARQTAAVGKRLGVQRLNLHGTGLGPGGLPVVPATEVTGAMWLAARDTLARIADLGEAEGVTFTLENLNTAVDHPGVPFARAEDTLALVAAVDHPASASTWTSITRRSARGTSSTSAADACPSSARSRSPTSPAAASPAPARSTGPPSPAPSTPWATPAPSVSKLSRADRPRTRSPPLRQHSRCRRTAPRPTDIEKLPGPPRPRRYIARRRKNGAPRGIGAERIG